jgi:hypothetical protein
MTPDELAKQYASMLDGELLELSGQFSELLPQAQQALTAELHKRGLNPSEPVGDEPTPLPVPPEYMEAGVDPDEVLVIRKFLDISQASIARGVLDSAGIECFLVHENLNRLGWSHLVGALELTVRREDAEVALKLLEPPPENDVEGQDEPE